jgi:hypothetical protein
MLRTFADFGQDSQNQQKTSTGKPKSAKVLDRIAKISKSP